MHTLCSLFHNAETRPLTLWVLGMGLRNMAAPSTFIFCVEKHSSTLNLNKNWREIKCFLDKQLLFCQGQAAMNVLAVSWTKKEGLARTVGSRQEPQLYNLLRRDTVVHDWKFLWWGGAILGVMRGKYKSQYESEKKPLYKTLSCLKEEGYKGESSVCWTGWYMWGFHCEKLREVNGST